MATQTTNLGLTKPGYDEAADIVPAVNNNMDTLDAKIGAVPANSSVQGQLDSHTQAIEALDENLTNARTIRKRITFAVTMRDAVLHFPGSGTANLGVNDIDIQPYVPTGGTLVAIIPGQCSRNYGQDYAFVTLSSTDDHTVRVIGTPNQEYACYCDILYRLY